MGVLFLMLVAVPRPFLPLDGQVVSDFALQFCWYDPSLTPEERWQWLRGKVKRRRRFIIEVARDAKFKRVVLRERVELAKPLFYSGEGWMPRRPLPEGRYFWRVAEVENGSFGPWSEVRSFRVEKGIEPKPPESVPSARRPLFIFVCYWPARVDDLLEMWRRIPEDLRPFCGIKLGWSARFIRSATPEDFLKVAEEALSAADREGIPLFLHLLPCLAEHLLRQHPSLKGLTTCEVARKWVNRPLRRKATLALVKLAAKYGRLFIWREPYWGFDVWNYVNFEDEEAQEVFRKFGRNIVLLWKMNSHDLPLLYQSHLLGWWLSGAICAWGTSCEVWYWKTAGYGRLGEQVEAKRGDIRWFPPPMLGVQCLLGVVGGGAVHYFETSGHPGTPGWDYCTRIYFPLVREILETKAIPTKEEVLRNVKVACLAKRPEDGNYDYHERTPYNALFEGTYGLRLHPNTHELIPNTGRFYLIPILPPFVKGAERKFERAVKADEFPSPEGFSRLFRSLYPEQRGTEAAMFKWGNHILVLPTWENRDVRERFEFEVRRGPIVKVEGIVKPHQYILFTLEENGLRAHAYRCPPDWTHWAVERGPRLPREAWEEWATEFEVEVTGDVVVRARPESSLLPVRRSGRRLEVGLCHEGGAATVWVEEKA